MAADRDFRPDRRFRRGVRRRLVAARQGGDLAGRSRRPDESTAQPRQRFGAASTAAPTLRCRRPSDRERTGRHFQRRGDINVDAAISWTSSSTTLTLSAFNVRSVNAPITNTSAMAPFSPDRGARRRLPAAISKGSGDSGVTVTGPTVLAANALDHRRVRVHYLRQRRHLGRERDARLRAAERTRFAGTVDGGHVLTANGGSVAFDADVGSIAPLGGLSVSGPVFLSGNVTTANGPITFNNAVLLEANVTINSGDSDHHSWRRCRPAFAAIASAAPGGPDGDRRTRSVFGGPCRFVGPACRRVADLDQRHDFACHHRGCRSPRRPPRGGITLGGPVTVRRSSRPDCGGRRRPDSHGATIDPTDLTHSLDDGRDHAQHVRHSIWKHHR